MVVPAKLSKRFLTLRARALLVLTTIFVVSHLLSLMVYESNRHKIVLLTESVDLADRIIGIVDLAERFPQSDRAQILAAAQTQFLFMYPDVIQTADSNCEQNDFSLQITERLNSWFTLYPGLDASVCVVNVSTDHRLADPLIGSVSGLDALVYIDFPDGEQAIFRAILPEAQSLFRDMMLFYFTLVGVASLLVGWYLISKVLTPLEQLATAADVIGTNLDAPALDEDGPSEVARAARAFNRMQARLKRLVHGQTEMIGAISHDLRSAATRLQLRAELLDNEHERDGMLRVVSDMRHMIESVLDFVRGVEPNEKPRRTDLVALLDSMIGDLQEEGFPVQFALHEQRASDQGALITCRPVSLRRCFQNLIDNAIKYGQEARVSCTLDADCIRIAVEDRGPGVAENELQNILRPFYRLDSSRNRDSGGIGLGLAITQNIVQLHGGKVLITNLTGTSDSGLRVEIVLPRS
ncbi:HAMP domain-containing protein [Gammaproteobacteria bacterium LSUCC0112]|nr:HAMP domain-containing protein [Gammaproteobacteria bacterium LSUCC0112]